MIAFYARGTGQGHLMRSLAVARLLKDLNPVVLHDAGWFEPCDREGVQQIVGGEARSWIAQAKLDALVVDVLIEGVKGEMVPLLDRLTIPKIYVYRYLREKPTAEQLARFDSVLVAEPDQGLSGLDGVDVCPILIRDPELLERGEGNIVKRPTTNTVYPFMEDIAKSTGVEGPAGYNLFWEAKALDVPGNFVALDRRFDDQQWRIDTFSDLPGGMANKAHIAADHIRNSIQRSA